MGPRVLNRVEEARPRRAALLRMVMVYSDSFSGKLGAEVIAKLKEKLGCQFNVEETDWKQELLRSPKLRQFAADEAARADMIIVASGATDCIPEELQAWFDLWQNKRHFWQGALVGLLDRRSMEPNQLDLFQPWLRKRAEAAGLEFFCHVEHGKKGPMAMDTALSDLISPFDFSLEPAEEEEVRQFSF